MTATATDPPSTPLSRGSLGAGFGSVRHASAFVGAELAGTGTLLAVGHLVPGAFLCAGLADLRTHAANLIGALAVAGHGTGRKDTGFRAVNVQRDATRHGRYVVLVQTGRSAMVARHGALIAGFDALGILLMWHIKLLSLLSLLARWREQSTFPKQARGSPEHHGQGAATGAWAG
jgi:hypothetical protein